MRLPRLVPLILMAVACTAAPTVEASRPPSTPSASPHPSLAPPSPTTDPPHPRTTPTIIVARSTAPWTDSIETALGDANVSVAVGVGDTIVFTRRARIPRVPASNEKILTSIAALDVFGPDHRFATTAASAATVHDGVLDGDLWVIGSGDPEVDAGSTAQLASAIDRAGIERIRGDVVGDTSAFTREWWAPGWVPGLSRSYINRTTALCFDGNAGDAPPEEEAAASLAAALASRGIEVAGGPAAGAAPDGLRPIARITSRPLRDLLAAQNHDSLNFYAETLIKALGEHARAAGEPATSTAAGAAVVTDSVTRPKVAVNVEDGSGLSHRDLVTARGMVTLLLLAQRAPWGEVLDASFAAPGEGTLDGRLTGIPVRAKTGTLFEVSVSALSGYVDDAAGHRVAFSILSEGLDKAVATRIEDAIVRALAGTNVTS